MKYLFVVMVGLALFSGCQSQTNTPESLNVRLAISTPDGHHYNLASNPSRLGSTGSRFHDIVLSESQMSKLIHLVRRKHSLPWQDMTAESPYPKAHTALLWYGSEPSGADSQMCSLGSPNSAEPVLEKVLGCLAES